MGERSDGVTDTELRTRGRHSGVGRSLLVVAAIVVIGVVASLAGLRRTATVDPALAFAGR